MSIFLTFSKALVKAQARTFTTEGVPVKQLWWFKQDVTFFIADDDKDLVRKTLDPKTDLHHEITGVWLGLSPDLLDSKIWFTDTMVLKDVRGPHSELYKNWRFIWMPDYRLRDADIAQKLW